MSDSYGSDYPQAPAAAAIDDTMAFALGPQVTEGSVGAMNTGMGAGTVQNKQVSVLTVSPLGYYAIVEEVEPVESTSGGEFAVITFDCVNVKFFWETLARMRGQYQPIEPGAATVEMRSAREMLLREMLKNENGSRCFLLRFMPKSVFMQIHSLYRPGNWVHASVKKAGYDSLTLLEDAAAVEPTADITIMTDDLFSDVAAPSDVLLTDRMLSSGEHAFLEEVYSLNHVPDADFGGGNATPIPPVPTPIILSNGAFSFDTGKSAFWDKPDPSDQVFDELQDEVFQGWLGHPGRARRRSTDEEYGVRGFENEGEYVVELRNATGCFQLTLDRGLVIAECVLPADETVLICNDEDQPLELVHPSGTYVKALAEVNPNVQFQQQPETEFTPQKAGRRKVVAEDLDESNKENLVEYPDPVSLNNIQRVQSPKNKIKILNKGGNYSASKVARMMR